MEPGQVRNFTITPVKKGPGFPSASFIDATSRVVRIDFPLSGDHDIGVALEFLSGTFCSLPIEST